MCSASQDFAVRGVTKGIRKSDFFIFSLKFTTEEEMKRNEMKKLIRMKLPLSLLKHFSSPIESFSCLPHDHNSITQINHLLEIH